ncbi:MAG: hypothetical protein QOG43_182 [Actinomycetota bacterium]|jgi:hypothetical protein|nr:hypothetical protein [Actinomycetota bacterium]
MVISEVDSYIPPRTSCEAVTALVFAIASSVMLLLLPVGVR